MPVRRSYASLVAVIVTIIATLTDAHVRALTVTLLTDAKGLMLLVLLTTALPTLGSSRKNEQKS